MPFCDEHESLCRDVRDIKQGIDSIKNNHLKHLNDKLNLVLWVVGVAFTTIAIIVGLIAQSAR
jgi:hypothetical protein